MRISLIGMTGIGKSYWSKKLSGQGFKRYGCDDLIGIKLEQHFRYNGFSGTRDVSKWLGQPYEPKYKQNSKIYLDFEKDVMHEILSELAPNTRDENIVIDTTGSIIYTGDEILKRLKNLTDIIYFETPDDMVDRMYKMYINNPKPVIWGDMFSVNSGESNQDALQRCYLPFLKSRQKQYASIADKTYSYTELHSKDFDLIKAIRQIN